MIVIAFVTAGAAAAAFVAVVVGIQVTDRRKRLRETYRGGITDAFARRVLGVYVRQKPKRAHDDDEFAQWLTRR